MSTNFSNLDILTIKFLSWYIDNINPKHISIINLQISFYGVYWVQFLQARCNVFQFIYHLQGVQKVY